MFLLHNFYIAIWVCSIRCQKGRVFFPGGGGTGGPIRQKFCQSPPPSDTCPRFWTKACPPSRGSSPKIRKILIHFCVKFDYFKAQKYLKKLYFMLKIEKNGLILHKVGSFGFSRIFFASPPHPTSSPSGTENFESPPHQKFREKTLKGGINWDQARNLTSQLWPKGI